MVSCEPRSRAKAPENAVIHGDIQHEIILTSRRGSQKPTATAAQQHQALKQAGGKEALRSHARAARRTRSPSCGAAVDCSV